MEDYENFRERVRDFAIREVSPLASEIDKTHQFPHKTIEKMGQQGLMGIPIPKEYEGAGLSTLHYVIAVEEISRVCGSTGLTLAAHTSLGTYPIYMFGTEEQKRKYLPLLASGKTLGSFGLTEPNAGSDAAAVETTVTPVPDGWVLNGSKRFITSSRFAGVIIVAAAQDKSKGVHGISSFIVERDTPGFSIGKGEEKLGLCGADTSELFFDNCKIPKENLLGKEYEGFKVFMVSLDHGRISIGAMALGIAQAALDASIEYVKSNNLRHSQRIQKLIADMGMEIEAARELLYHTAKLKERGRRITKEAAMAKLYASEVAMRACIKAVELHRQDGVTSKFPVERFLRDAKLTEIGEGTSEIQRIVIARQVLGRD